jgi:hypothetical protein
MSLPVSWIYFWLKLKYNETFFINGDSPGLIRVTEWHENCDQNEKLKNENPLQNSEKIATESAKVACIKTELNHFVKSLKNTKISSSNFNVPPDNMDFHCDFLRPLVHLYDGWWEVSCKKVADAVFQNYTRNEQRRLRNFTVEERKIEKECEEAKKLFK